MNLEIMQYVHEFMDLSDIVRFIQCCRETLSSTELCALLRLRSKRLTIRYIDVSLWRPRLCVFVGVELSLHEITGNISQWSSLTSFNRLQTLNVSDTDITGNIAQWTSLGSLIQLRSLDLSNTGIIGNVSEWTSLGLLIQLEILILDDTEIRGDVSEWTSLANLTNLGYLSLENTGIRGDISQWSSLSLLTLLEQLHIWNTAITANGESNHFHIMRWINLFRAELQASA